MISNTGQILRMNVFFFFVRTILSIQPSRTDPKYLNANGLNCFIFCCLQWLRHGIWKSCKDGEENTDQ